MIPDIGIMIAAYIITRMAQMFGQPSAMTHPIAKVLAVITILVTIVLGLDLLLRGSAGFQSLPNSKGLLSGLALRLAIRALVS